MDEDFEDYDDNANMPNRNVNEQPKPLPKQIKMTNPNTLNQVSNMIKTVSPMITYFVPLETTEYMEWGQTILVILFLAAMFISIILMYIYMANALQNLPSCIAPYSQCSQQSCNNGGSLATECS